MLGEHEHQDQEHFARVERVGDSVPRSAHHRRPLRRLDRIELPRPHHQQAREDREEADSVDREADPGTEGGGMVTRVGDHGLFMVGAHVAHDCQIGDHVIMANNATLAGHVVVEDYALLGGLSAVHQFVRIGQHAMIGGMSGVERDVIPYGQVMGDRARLSGLNIIGMQRRGFSREDIQTLRSAYQFLFSADGTFNDRVTEMAERFGGVAPVDDIIAFIRADSTRAICQPKGPNGG